MVSFLLARLTWSTKADTLRTDLIWSSTVLREEIRLCVVGDPGENENFTARSQDSD